MGLLHEYRWMWSYEVMGSRCSELRQANFVCCHIFNDMCWWYTLNCNARTPRCWSNWNSQLSSCHSIFGTAFLFMPWCCCVLHPLHHHIEPQSSVREWSSLPPLLPRPSLSTTLLPSPCIEQNHGWCNRLTQDPQCMLYKIGMPLLKTASCLHEDEGLSSCLLYLS